jgi:hypothetical protein
MLKSQRVSRLNKIIDYAKTWFWGMARVGTAFLVSLLFFFFWNLLIYRELPWVSRSLHSFGGFQPVSLTRQADLIRVASGGVVVKPIDKKKRGA